MDTFSMLEELLEQDQFELILPEEQSKETWVNFTAQSYHGSLPLVYLMNDAVESFRVIRDKANIVAGSARCECAVLSVERPYGWTISRLSREIHLLTVD